MESPRFSKDRIHDTPNAEKQAVGGQVPGTRVDQNDPPITTADRLATAYKVSAPTIKRDGKSKMDSLRGCKICIPENFAQNFWTGIISMQRARICPPAPQGFGWVECGVRASTSYRPPAPARSTSYRQAVATAQQQRQPCACARTRGEATGQY